MGAKRGLSEASVLTATEPGSLSFLSRGISGDGGPGPSVAGEDYSPMGCDLIKRSLFIYFF